ncbi:MAG: VCBS repeat-containing protein, partial [Verrucomicrobiota bacterium]
MRFPIALVLLAAGFLCSCGESPTVPSSRPFAGPPPKAGGKTFFTKLDPAATGIDYVNPVVGDHPMRRLFSSSMVVGGVAVGDMDGDEKPDLFFTNGPKKNALYRQTGEFTWEDITEQAGVDGGDNWGVGTTMVDIDNDGDLDLYICNHDTPNELYLNEGAGGFTESAADFGLDLVEASHTPAFCDFDRDGDLDLYLLTNKYYNPKGKLPENLNVVGTRPGRVRGAEDIFIKPEYEKYVVIKEVRPKPTGGYSVDWEEDGRPDYFFRNEGNGAFKNVTKEVGINSVGYGLSATWWDYNEDGWTDLYVANDFDGA